MLIVTGANGMIGSNLALSCAQRGRLLHVDDYPSIRGSHQPVEAPPTELRYEALGEATYLDWTDLPDWLDRDPDGVAGILHLGACSDTTVTDRDFVMRVNFDATRNLWNRCAAAGIPFIYASSAATYGDGTQGYDDDVDPARYQPLNLYGQSKQDFDLWALQQPADQSPPRWAGLKYFNVYGPRELHKRRMASVALHAFDQIREAGRVKLFQSHKPGIPDGGQQRDFVFVDDVVAITLHFLDTPASATAPNGLYNAGTGQARTFADLARAVFAALQHEPDIEYIPMPQDLRGKYQYFTQAQTQKLRRAGFDQPFHTLEQGVASYVAWLQAHAPQRQPT